LKIFTPGQKKLDAVICPDPWKDGARNTTESGGRKINENKLLNKNRRKIQPYGGKESLYGSTCKICRQQLHQPGHYCQGCAYKKGFFEVSFLSIAIANIIV